MLRKSDHVGCHALAASGRAAPWLLSPEDNHDIGSPWVCGNQCMDLQQCVCIQGFASDVTYVCSSARDQDVPRSA